jgi:hypothetical protein
MTHCFWTACPLHVETKSGTTLTRLCFPSTSNIVRLASMPAPVLRVWPRKSEDVKASDAVVTQDIANVLDVSVNPFM